MIFFWSIACKLRSSYELLVQGQGTQDLAHAKHKTVNHWYPGSSSEPDSLTILDAANLEETRRLSHLPSLSNPKPVSFGPCATIEPSHHKLATILSVH
eukprot:134063-Amphidinium_carterae.1